MIAQMPKFAGGVLLLGLSPMVIGLVGCSRTEPATKTRVEVHGEKLGAASKEPAQFAGKQASEISRASFEAADPDFSPAIPELQLPFESWSDQQVAADALSRIGKPAVPQLIEALHHPDPKVRRAATSVLARMGSEAKDAVPALIQLLDDENASVRRCAAKTLGRIGPDAAEAVPALVRTLMESQDVQPASHESPVHDTVPQQ